MKKKIKTKTIRVIDFVKSRPIVRLVKIVACFMLAISSQAASVVWMESGTDATGDLSFWGTSAGTVATDATVSHTGPRSLKLSTTGVATTASLIKTGVLSDAGRRVTFWFKVNAITATNSATLLALRDTGALSVFAVLAQTTGKLQYTPIGATAVMGARVLSANTWYRMDISYTVSSTVSFRFDCRINGTLDGSCTAGTLTRTGTDRLYLFAANVFGPNVDIWFDDFYIDDGTDYTDPGNILVTAKKPSGNNVNNYDTAVGNNPANRWENVNEVPLSIANGWQQLAIADTQENYTLQTRAVGDVDISAFPIVGRLAWIWAKETAVLGTPKIMDNGTESAITLTTSPALYTIVSTDGVYPSNAAGIGMRSAVTAAGTFLYECGTLIAYTAPVTPNAMMSFFFK